MAYQLLLTNNSYLKNEIKWWIGHDEVMGNKLRSKKMNFKYPLKLLDRYLRKTKYRSECRPLLEKDNYSIQL